MTATYIGPDTVDLVFRDPAAGVDEHGRPNTTERVVPKGNSCLTVTTAIESRQDGTVVIYNAKAALPVDPDTVALKSTDAIRGDGKTFDLSGDAVVKRHLLTDEESHVRVFAMLEVPTLETGELVLIQPKAGRDDSGQPKPDPGPQRETIARGVYPGNTAKRLGFGGELDAADFTVVLDVDDPIRDGDVMTLRGRRGYVRVAKKLESWADASTKVVMVRSLMGGRR
jgi:hypothetical protein